MSLLSNFWNALTGDDSTDSAVQMCPAPDNYGLGAAVTEPDEREPCDFDRVTIECSHCGGHKDSKRTISGADIALIDGAKEGFGGTFEVVPHDDSGDKITIEAAGGPGYGCGENHPEIRVWDRTQGAFVKNESGKTRVDFTAEPNPLPGVTSAIVDPLGFIKSLYFPSTRDRCYRVDVDACGIRSGGEPSMDYVSVDVIAHPLDVYEMSIKIPPLQSLEYSKSTAPASLNPGGATHYSESTTVKSAFGSEETKSTTDVLYYDDSNYAESNSLSYQDRTGSVSVDTFQAVSNASGALDSASAGSISSDDNPIDHPVQTVGASFSLKRNGAECSQSASIGQLINFVVNLQNAIQSVMNFIKDFQPQVGWKFTFQMKLFEGEITFSWGWKEWEDHRAYRWWQVAFKMTIIEVKGELSFGASFTVGWVGVTAVVFGNLSMSVTGELSTVRALEGSPPVELKMTGEPGGEVGVRAELGANWLSVEGKFSVGFPLEATAKFNDDEPFHIDWQLGWTGVKAKLTGHCPAGDIDKEWQPIEGNEKWKSGTFPEGDEQQSGIQKN